MSTRDPGFERDQSENKWTLGLGLVLPLFQHNGGGIAAASSRREREAARFEALQARVIGDVDAALTAYRESRRATTAAAGWLDHLVSQERIARTRLDAGQISRFEFDLSRLERLEADGRRFEATVAAQRALGSVEDAMQRPLGWSESLWLDAPRETTARHRQADHDATSLRPGVDDATR
ncbi:MAG: TolC family protein [Acidobacteriota bacterium]